MNKRGQLVTNILIFVIGLIVIGLVVLFGYQVIQGMSEDRCEVLSIQFGTSLQQAIDNNKAWGTSRVVQLQAPCEAAHICMVDQRVIQDPDDYSNYHASIDQGELPSDSAIINIINSSVQTNLHVQGDRTNVFSVNNRGGVSPLARFSTEEAPIKIGESNPGAKCFPVQNGRLEVRMQGDGTRAEVTRP